MRPLRLALLPLLALAGCHLVFPHAPERRDVAIRESSIGRLDQPHPELPPPSGSCSLADLDTIALWSFDTVGDPGKDDAPAHAHPIASFQGTIVFDEPGAPGCGNGIHLTPQAGGLPSYAVIDASDAWDQVLSIELRARFDGAGVGSSEAILSRDASGTAEPGHFTLFRDCAGRIALRLQRQGTDGELHLCSPVVVEKERWVKIVVNFHPAELRVEGDSSQLESSTCAGLFAPCQVDAAFEHGIEGNHNPWVLGASLVSATQGTTDRVTLGMAGSLDEVRLSRVRR